jgi:hypothetical protein
MEIDTHLPTKYEINTLVSYLPRLYEEGFEPIARWEGGEKNDQGVVQMPYPIYDPLVEEFMRTTASEGWMDYGYRPEQAYMLLKDDQAIARANLNEIKSMLTFIVRGERFSDGHWGSMISQGYVQKVLRRLAELAR